MTYSMSEVFWQTWTLPPLEYVKAGIHILDTRIASCRMTEKMALMAGRGDLQHNLWFWPRWILVFTKCWFCQRSGNGKAHHKIRVASGQSGISNLLHVKVKDLYTRFPNQNVLWFLVSFEFSTWSAQLYPLYVSATHILGE